MFAFKNERKRDCSTVFRCRATDSSGKECIARVVVSGTSYSPNNDHTCTAKPEANVHEKHTITREAKIAGLKCKAVSAGNIIQPLMQEHVYSDVVLPDPILLARTVNRARAKERPTHPTDLHFTLDRPNMPKHFLRGDILVGPEGQQQRHLIFSTKKQLRLLREMKRWYLDGTFRLVKKPMMQLWTIHGFLKVWNSRKKRHEIKQVPLLYVLMSRRTAADYEAVLLHIREKIFQDEFSLEEVVCDFEKAVWRTVQVMLFRFNLSVVLAHANSQS